MGSFLKLENRDLCILLWNSSFTLLWVFSIFCPLVGLFNLLPSCGSFNLPSCRVFLEVCWPSRTPGLNDKISKSSYSPQGYPKYLDYSAPKISNCLIYSLYIMDWKFFHLGESKTQHYSQSKNNIFILLKWQIWST